MKKIIIVLVMGQFLMAGCSNSAKNNDCTSDECLKQQAYDGVIAVHDEVMPKLSQISDLKGKLEQRMDATTDTAEIAQLKELMVNLDDADEAMWVWMRQFNSDVEALPLEEALSYLQAEKVKIEEVADKLNNALQVAEEELK